MGAQGVGMPSPMGATANMHNFNSEMISSRNSVDPTFGFNVHNLHNVHNVTESCQLTEGDRFVEKAERGGERGLVGGFAVGSPTSVFNGCPSVASSTAGSTSSLLSMPSSASLTGTES
jgi:hypothetical protein